MKLGLSGAVCLALAAGWTIGLAAQGPQTQTDASTDTIALRGCVARGDSAAAGTSGTAEHRAIGGHGNFVLTNARPVEDASAMTAQKTVANQKKTAAASQYRLDGPDSMVAPYVGNEIQITGSIEQPAGGAAGAASKGTPTLELASVRLLASNCQ
jgi:hypothetical protein